MRCLRLCAMLAGGTVELLEKMDISVKGDELILTLQPEAAIHSGEVVMRRLQSVATAFDLAPKLNLD